jgi:DNA polymerase III subunit delta
MPSFKAAYLIHGDDHGRIAERRARLRLLAEQQGGVAGIELCEGDRAAPDAVAAALNTLTFATGRRFIIVDGVERWKDRELEPLLAALGQMPPETTVAFFAREEGRFRVPEPLREAVVKAGGDVAAETTVKPWELPKWVAARGRELGLELGPEAARALVAKVGERQQRLLRELEKLALDQEATPASPRTVDAGLVEELSASSAERKGWTLADALLAGGSEPAVRALLALRAQGERVSGLVYMMASRVREAHRVAVALERGGTAAQIRPKLRMPPRAADKLIADAGRIGADGLRDAVCAIADLELASRGGGQGGAGEDTRALLAIRELTT